MRSLEALSVIALVSLFTLCDAALAAVTPGRAFDGTKTILRVGSQNDTYNIGYVVFSETLSGPCVPANTVFINVPSTSTANFMPSARNLFEMSLAAQIVGRPLTDLVYDWDANGYCTMVRAAVL